jgi:hypothetical protein
MSLLFIYDRVNSRYFGSLYNAHSYSVFDKSVSGKTLALEPIDKKIQRELVERLFAQNAFDRKLHLTFDLCVKTT